MAVFLALGLGILLGSSVVSDAVDAQLADDLRDAIADRRQARTDRTVALRERDDLADLLEKNVAPWAIEGRLEGRPVVLVVDGDTSGWQGHVTRALDEAGAELSGVIALTEKWRSNLPKDREDLARAMETEGDDFDPGTDAAATAFTMLGGSFLEPAAESLLEALDDEGFVTLQDRPGDGAWPPPAVAVVFLSASREAEDEPTPGAASFARALADLPAPALVVTDDAKGPSLVAALREQRRDGDLAPLPEMLSTFDGATSESDPGGIGVVTSLIAAADERGGDFGTAGESFIPPPAPRE